MTAWRDLVDRAATELGPVTPALARHWRAELDDAERLVTHLERPLLEQSQPVQTKAYHGGDDGLHAFVALAGARLGDDWDPRQLIDVAAAVELAYRATRHHRAVLNTDGLDSAAGRDDARDRNTRVVLDGDWSITQAAVLVADIGPTAYRLLVRGYGATQVGQLSGVADPLGLVRAALALGGLVAGVRVDVAEQVWAQAGSPPPHHSVHQSMGQSVPIAVLAWAIRAHSLAVPTNALSVAVSAPIDVHGGSRSTTTSPAVGRS